MFRRMPLHRKYTYTPTSVHLRAGIAKMLVCQFRRIAELSDVDIIGGE